MIEYQVLQSCIHARPLGEVPNATSGHLLITSNMVGDAARTDVRSRKLALERTNYINLVVSPKKLDFEERGLTVADDRIRECTISNTLFGRQVGQVYCACPKGDCFAASPPATST